jgi:hypothetical protein
LEKKEWTKINNILKNKKKSQIISNDIIKENDRIALTVNQIDNKFNPSEKNIERFFISENKKENYKTIIQRDNRIFTTYINHKSKMYDKFSLNLEQESFQSNDVQTIMQKKFKEIITPILNNTPVADIQYCLDNVQFNLGRDILCQILFKKGFRVTKKLEEECFESLLQICICALNSINNLEESQNIFEFAVKITSSAFYYCREKKTDIFLIDEIRNNLGKDFPIWNKNTFWNTWINLQDYYIIKEYSIYCQVIVHDFLNKLIRLKLDNDFIITYIISALAEKMILLEQNFELSQETIKKNQQLFNEYRTKLIELVNIQSELY